MSRRAVPLLVAGVTGEMISPWSADHRASSTDLSVLSARVLGILSGIYIFKPLFDPSYQNKGYVPLSSAGPCPASVVCSVC